MQLIQFLRQRVMAERFCKPVCCRRKTSANVIPFRKGLYAYRKYHAMKNIRTSSIICSIMLMGVLINTGCAAEQEESVVTEPTANCEITGYVQYAG